MGGTFRRKFPNAFWQKRHQKDKIQWTTTKYSVFKKGTIDVFRKPLVLTFVVKASKD
jgi:hypothetical protein